jgi:GDP-D-mannose 3',5'-epimerase
MNQKRDELADIVIWISGKRITKEYDVNAPQGVRGRNADLTLVRKQIGWELKAGLEEGLARTYKWVAQKVREDQEAPGLVMPVP